MTLSKQPSTKQPYNIKEMEDGHLSLPERIHAETRISMSTITNWSYEAWKWQQQRTEETWLEGCKISLSLDIDPQTLIDNYFKTKGNGK